VGRLTKKSNHLLSDREIFILESLRPEGRKSKSLCVGGGRGNAWSLCLCLCALQKMTAAWVDIRQKFKHAAQGKEVSCSYILEGQVERKGCFICHMCYIWSSTAKPLF